MRCARCGRDMEYLEAAINDRKLCHPDDPELPDCYAIESHQQTTKLAGDSVTLARHSS